MNARPTADYSEERLCERAAYQENEGQRLSITVLGEIQIILIPNFWARGNS